jgi:hypothetical protein
VSVGKLVWLLVAAGVGVRFGLAVVNPPGNAYDDHLSAAAYYSTLFSPRPDPWACWECYQPPTYYRLAAAGARALEAAGAAVPWKAAQYLSAGLSAVALLLGVLSLQTAVRGDDRSVLAGTAMLAFLPRSVYSAAAASNDAMLEAAVALGLLGVVWSLWREERRTLGAALIAIAAIWAGWTKQSGLLMMGPAGVVVVGSLRRHTPPWVPALLGMAIFIAGADEIWRIGRTGVVLASNQLYFDHAADQPPGALTHVAFDDFRLVALMNDVFLGPRTLPSWWTELFARLWFDYERRFFPASSTAMFLGRGLYGVGLAAVATTMGGIIARLRRRGVELRELALASILLGYLGVPLIQTIRYPVYSSMKAAFLLPAAPVMAIAFAWATGELSGSRPGRAWAHALIVALAVVGALHAAGALVLNTEAMSTGLSGPLWPLPAVPR